MIKKAVDFLYEGALRYKSSVGWILGFLIAISMILLYEFDVFERLELLTLDGRFIVRNIQPKPSPVVFIDMAEDSIEVIGRWPWPRKWHATIVKILSEYKPKVIAFDVIFSEPQDELDDAALEEAIMRSGAVYFPLLYELDPQKLKYLYMGEGVDSILEPLPRFRDKIKGRGHINAMADSDGIMRRIPPVISYKGSKTYQLGIKIGCDILGIKDKDIVFYPDAHKIVMKREGAKPIIVPLDRNNQMIIDWQGKWGKDFQHYSYIDVVKSYLAIKEGKKPLIDLNIFKDKICIIGLTAAGLIDIKPIPIESAYPAVGVNATAVNSILANKFIYDAPELVDIFLILIICLSITVYLCRMRILGGMVLTLISAVLYALISIAAFSIFNIAIVTFYPILGIFLSYTLTATYTQIVQTTERARLFKQATRDGLTHLYNIRHFNLLFEAEFRNVSLYKSRKLSILMADLDHFKNINDTYGHQTGDIVLKEAAHVIQSCCRQIDVIARYGGEEIIVMLTGAGEKEASDVGEKIRAAMAEKRFKSKDKQFQVTISIGLAEYANEKNKDELVEKADQALYKSKNTGRNRVCTYSTVCPPK